MIPQALADKLNMPLFASQILCSAIMLLIVLLPISILAGKSKNSWLIELFVGITMSCFCVAIGWLPVYILILIALIVVITLFPNLSASHGKSS